VAQCHAQESGPLAARVGIATGLVVVGELIGRGAAQEQTVVGETPNLAARLQTLAEPGSVVVSRRTRRLVGGLFELADAGTHRLKGFAELVPAWSVLGESRAESRFEALRGLGLTPLVGREQEIDLLLERWQRANEGEGHVVLLSGEPGIGKSRIVRDLRERLRDQCFTPLSHYCSPHHTSSVFYPVVRLLERAAGLSREDPPGVQLEKLKALLAPATDAPDEAVRLLAALLAIPTGDRYPPLALTPQRQKARTLEVLLEQLERLAAERPVLAVYEDVHWMDPSTLELLSMVVDRAQSLPVLVVITCRPEFRPPWTGHAHVTQLSLARLTRRQGAAIVARIAGGKSLPPEVLDQILARTEGVPLFVEELTKTVLESGLLEDADDRYVLAGPVPPLGIPATLHDSLMARLDRLAPVKEVAQIGAAIGREFSHALLAEIAPLGESRLRDALQQLTDAELVFRRGTPPDATYSFKHALVQEAAYESLLRSRRQQLHERIAQVLEERFPDTSQTQPEVLAHHYAQAGLVEKAIRYAESAGKQAARRAATPEAIQHFRNALELLRSTPEGRVRDVGELRVLTQLGPALMLARGWADPEVETAYHRAGELARGLEESADLVPPLVGLWLFYLARGRFEAADETTCELFQIAHALDDPELLLQAHHAAWPTPMLRGAFGRSHDHIRHGLALYDYERHKHHAFLYMGHDPAVCGHALAAGVVWMLGLPEQADRHAADALDLARRLRHAPTLAFALWFIAGAHAARGDHASALTTTEELFQLSEDQKLVQTRTSALIIGGWATACSGQAKQGVEQLRAGLAEWCRIGIRNYLQPFTCLLAESLMHAGRYAEALEHLEQASALGNEIGELWWEARIHRLRGDLLLHSGARDKEAAVHGFETAIQVARTQDAKGFELQAARSLAQLWAERGRRADARDLLAPIYAWFTEGLDTPDLVAAKALLDDLG
jgi:predicted ATPase